MIFKLSLCGLFMVAFGQGVQEKGNLDDLIGDVFGKNPNEARTDVVNEKVKKAIKIVISKLKTF